MRPTRRGFTLAESVVALGLFTMVSTMTWQVLSPNLRLWERSRTRTEVEQGAMVAETRLVNELRESCADSVTCIGIPPGFSFATLDPHAPYDPDTGKAAWQGVIAYVLDTENHVLYRKSTSTATQLSPAELVQLLTSENGTERAVSNYVMTLTVTAPVQGVMHVSLRYAWPEDDGQQVVDHVIDVQMRNVKR